MSQPRRRSSRTPSPSAKNTGQAISSPATSPQTPVPHPAPDDRDGWRAYWTTQGQPWRTEPEIDATRQKALTAWRAIVPDNEKGTYPFKGKKLTRADVEWLLATHESGGIVGPVDLENDDRDFREGLDLRGADLEQVNLQGVQLDRAQLQGAILFKAQLQGASLAGAWLERANLSSAQLQGAYLRVAHLQKAHFSGSQLQGARLDEAELQGANFFYAELQRAHLSFAHLQGASLMGAKLQGAFLDRAQLQEATLDSAKLQGANLSKAVLEGATLDKVTLSDEKDGTAYLADVRWGDPNLAMIDWEPVRMLGEERRARQKKDGRGETKKKQMRLDEYKEAVRANRQLAVVLRNQGLNEEADLFGYRAQVLQKSVLRLQITRQGAKPEQRLQALGAWLFSWFLFLLIGYGFKPSRWLLVYLGTIIMFAALHFLMGTPHPTWLNALTMSILNLHGRPFLNAPSGPEGGIDVVEAFVGLIVEAVLIAIITQRILGKEGA